MSSRERTTQEDALEFVPIDEAYAIGQVAAAASFHETGDQDPGVQIEYRQYQRDCLDKLHEARLGGSDAALIHLATGLGKTTIVALDVKQFLDERPDGRVLFLCHNNDILTQARQRFEQILDHNTCSFGEFTGRAKEREAVTCLFASFQTMRGHKQSFAPDAFDYIVVDESHHAKAETYEPTLAYFQAQPGAQKPVFKVGMTGTPDREDLRDIREIFGPEIYSKSLPEALAEHLLARPDYRVILDEIQEEALAHAGEVSLAELNRSLFIPRRDEDIARRIVERSASVADPHRIIFCPSIEHTERLAAYLPDAKTYHSDLDIEERVQRLADFKAGRFSTILAVDSFNEGVDTPDANVIVFLRSTASQTVFFQQLGRGLRRTADKKSVLVLDFVANCDRLLTVDALVEETMRLTRFGERRGPYAGQSDFESDVSDMRELHIGSFEFTETSRRIIGTIREALAARNRLNSWTADDSVRYYLGLMEQIGRTPNIIDITEAGKALGNPGYSLLMRDFHGSIQELRAACGLEQTALRNFWVGWGARDSLDYYRALSDTLGRPAIVDDINRASKNKEGPGLNLLTKPFGGSLPKLKEVAGYPVKTRGRTWNPEMSLEYYQEMAERLGRTPTDDDVDKASKAGDGPSRNLLYQGYGSLAALRGAAGLQRPGYYGWTEEQQFVDYYRTLSERLGRPAEVPDINDANKQGRGPNMTLFYRRHLSIPELRERCGYPLVVPYNQWTFEQLGNYVNNLSARLGHPASMHDIDEAAARGEGPSYSRLIALGYRLSEHR